MTNMMLPVGPASSRARMDLLTHIQLCGMTSDLKICLDAGDDASYSTGQTWTDVATGVNFYRGSDGSSNSSDPTFNGTAGRRSVDEYFTSDGGDYFTSVSSTPTWLKNINRDARLSMFISMYVTNGSDACILSTASNSLGDHGMFLEVANQTGNTFVVFTMSNSAADDIWQTATTIEQDVNTIFSRSYEIEAEGAIESCYLNGNSLNIAAGNMGTTETPHNDSTPNETNIRIGDRVSSTRNWDTGHRKHSIAIWDVFKYKEQHTALVMSYRGKFSR